MELKTRVRAPENRQEIFITRKFDIPVDLLFKAHTEAEFLSQWMGTNVRKLDARNHGSYLFETCDGDGNVVFKANGTFHECIPNKSLIRTFKMENTTFDVQLEFFAFESITSETSQLRMQIVFKSIEQRDQLLKMPFAQGLNMAHGRLENIFK